MSNTLFESKHTIINASSDFLLSRAAVDTEILRKVKMVVFTQQFNNQEEEDFLKKILTACKMTSSDYCILALKQDEKIAWNQFLSEFLQTN